VSRTIGSVSRRVAIADDSGLIYSDDYRNGWLAGFKAMGCEVRVFDVKVLRRAGIGGSSPYRSVVMPGTGKAIAREIAKWKPSLVFAHHGRSAGNTDFLNELHRSGIKTACYLCDEPYESGETTRYSPGFRFVFTMDPCTVEAHRNSRPDRKGVFYLPPGVDTTLFKPRLYSKRTGPSAFFLGNAKLTPRTKWFEPVQRLVEGADIRFFQTVGKTHPKWIPARDHPEHYANCIVGLNVHRDPSITQDCWKKRVIGRSRHTPIPAGLTLAKSQPRQWGTGFWNDGNLPASHVNPRFFEFAACGTLVVSDNHRAELRRMFPMAPQASDPDHFAELVLHYIEHQDEAEAIGQECSSLTSRRHSYRHRAAEILIRTGCLAPELEGQLSSLGEQVDWMTPQDCERLTSRSSSDPTGRSERWSPRYGMSLTRTSGRVSDQDSLDAPTPY